MSKKKINGIEGIYQGVSKLFGFVVVGQNTEYEEKIYVNHKDSCFALDNDKVLVYITKNSYADKNAEGKIVKILERDTDVIIGIFESKKNFAFVRPLSKKIQFDVHIDKKFFKNAVNESIVECKILDGVNIGKNDSIEGIINNVLGHKTDPNATILAITKEHKINTDFDDKVISESEQISNNIDKKSISNRKDLRNLITFTIDGEDAKDLDDAVSLEILDNGHKILYVSIADVSYYVKENSFIDKEARKRGNSVYLVDRVIPMLPRVLCNGICSLNEKEDRFAKTCEMEFDENGKVVKSHIYESIINSNKRMTYNAVHTIISKYNKNSNNQQLNSYNEDLDSYKSYEEILLSMFELSQKIRLNREKNGSIDFDFKEANILVDENVEPIDIRQYERYEAHKMIEDFMLIANETVAKEFYNKKIPFLYRIHEECDKDKIQNLINILPIFNLSLNYNGKLKPKNIQDLLKKIKNTDYEYVVSKLTLRSMQQAKYSIECLGHFALSLKYYTHFTSPIRRYSDLTIHRIIGEYLHNELTEKRINHYNKILADIAMSTSVNERKAIDCERDVDDYLKCKYMKKYIGETFDGIISGVTNFGIFVELENTVEGMIPMRELDDDYYIFNDETLELCGEKNKKLYRMGMKLKVILTDVSIENKTIDFKIV